MTAPLESTVIPAQRFEKIIIFQPNGEMLDMGTLSAYPDRLEFDGKRVQATFPNVRGAAFEVARWNPGDLQAIPRVRVTHGTGDDLSTSYMMVSTIGLPKRVREVNRRFSEALRDIYGETHLSGTDQQLMTNIDDNVREAKLRGARRYIWVGLALALGGAVVTVITYANATGGGTYVIAWGAIVGGVLMLIAGLLNSRN